MNKLTIENKTQETKKCGTQNNGCKKELPLDSFHLSKSHEKGRHPLCKDCRKKLIKKHNVVRPHDNTIVICSHCKKEKTAKDFTKSSSTINGLQSICKDCSSIIQIEKKITFDGYVSTIYNNINNNNKKRTKNVKCTITEEDIKSLYVKQNEKCALANLSLKTNIGYDFSVDRINSNKDYTLDNIQLVTVKVNKLKWDFDQDDVIKKAIMISKN